MTAPKTTKKRGGGAGRHPKTDEERYKPLGVTLSPEVHAILKKWRKEHGPGSTSHDIGRAIRYAEMKGLFDDEARARLTDAGSEPSTLEGAFRQHLPQALESLVRTALSGGKGSGLPWRRSPPRPRRCRSRKTETRCW